MRVLTLTSGIVVAALLQAMPVAAHGGRATQDAAPPSASHSGPPPVVCEIDLARLEAFLASKADAPSVKRDAAAKAAGQEPAKPTPSDNSHKTAVAQKQAAAPCAVPSDDPNGVVTSPPTSAPLG